MSCQHVLSASLRHHSEEISRGAEDGGHVVVVGTTAHVLLKGRTHPLDARIGDKVEAGRNGSRLQAWHAF